jgi:membrane associated rhomboid family serine protease
MTTDATLPTCRQHPDRETRLACPRCRRPICAQCLVEAGDGGQVCATCRDELATAATAVRQPRLQQSGAPITFGLLLVFALIFVAGEIDDGILASTLNGGAQVNVAVRAGEWWRVLTATMLHANLTHLLFNGYALYALGAHLERSVGSGGFAALYLASGIAGGVAFLFSSPEQVAVGASGAIFGLFGAWFAASWVNRDTPHGRAGLSQFGMLLLINLALPLFIPGIAWQAHMGGMAAGLLVGFDWARRTRSGTRPTAQARLVVPLLIAGALLLGLLWYTMA